MEKRNLAIIAHVDHGKTTLVSQMLKQSGTFKEHQHVEEQAMDTNDLEKERGITILAKCTSLIYNDVRLNIVDTPGHADFGGEVERILSMVDGVVVLVDAAEGPMPQTKFVVGKALKLGLRPIVVINKLDRSDQRAKEVVDEIFDLFVALDATDEQLDFPILYASGRSGWAIKQVDDERVDLTCLFETIISHVKKPDVCVDGPFQMLVTTREYDPYLGRVLTGRIQQGKVKTNMAIKALDMDSNNVETGRITKILSFRGLERYPIEEAEAGDIVVIAGFSKATVSNTLCAPEVTQALKAQPIDPPTLAMTFAVNSSPLAGKEGSKLTSRMIYDRLMREAEGNVALQISMTEDRDAFEVAGRGELQLGVLIETMRREGFELSISRPRVLLKKDDQGNLLEPMEEIFIDVDEEYVGSVVEALSQRKCDMTDMFPSGAGKTRIIFKGPSRGLIGLYGPFLTMTRGTGVLNRVFFGYDLYRGPIVQRINGVLISNGTGVSVAYALWNLEERGKLFIGPREDVYTGMIIGENSRENDLEVNPMKAKQLTNMRASGTDEAVRLTPHEVKTLEQAMAYIQDDELLEVTPTKIRLRKRYLDPNERKRMSSSKKV